MNRDDVLDAQAAFSELYNACQPPSHSDMDVAFARAKVESPKDSDAKWGVNKRDRVRVAFEDALTHGDERVNRLIEELVRTLRQARVFTYQSEDIELFTSELRTALRKAGRILDEEGGLQPVTEAPLPVREMRAQPPASAPRNVAAEAGPLGSTRTDALSPPQEDAQSTSIFLVHGHDETTALRIQRDVRQITGIEPSVLADQPSGGRTVIGKFEHYANQSGYAIVLMTADDAMAQQGEAGEPVMRARQNVILELGYFMGKLGRHRVLVLQDGVEWPSDMAGVVYVDMRSSNWMEQLRRELRAAGFEMVG